MPRGTNDKTGIVDRTLGAGGVNTGVDPFQLQPPDFLQARNCYVVKDGELRKRPGHDALGTSIIGGGTVSTARGLVGSEKRLLLRDDSGWLEYDAVGDKWRRQSTDNSWLNMRTYPVDAMGPGASSWTTVSCGYAGGYLVIYGVTGSTVGTAVYDTDMTLVHSFSDGGTGWRLVQAGSTLFRVVVSSGNITVQKFNTSTFAWDSVAAALAADAHASNRWDAIGTSDGRLIVAYYTVTTGYLTVLYSAVGGATVAASYVGSELMHDSDLISVVKGTTDIFVAYTLNGLATLRCIQVSTAGALVNGPSNLDASFSSTTVKIVGHTNGTNVYWFWQIPTSGAQLDDVKYGYATEAALTVTTGVNFILGMRIRNKPFTYNSHVYLPIYYGTDDAHTVQPTSFLVDENADVVTAWFQSDSGITMSGSTLPQHPASISATKFGFVDFRSGPAVPNISTPGTIELRYQPQMVICDMAPIFGNGGLPIRNDLFVPGSVLVSADAPLQPGATIGQRLTPPYLFPEIITGALAGSNGAGSLTNLGVYRYRLTYEVYDAEGRRWLSAPSYNPAGFPDTGLYAQITLGAADDTVTITAPALRLNTGQEAFTRINVWRTENGGSLFYYCTSGTNVTNADTVSITDLMSDATLITQELLYTTSGELDNIAPPAIYDLAADPSHLYIIPQDDRSSLWVSKPFRDGRGFEFSTPGLVYDFPALGDLEKVVPRDSIILLLGRDYIGYLQGEGRNALGQGGYSPTKVLPGSVGCKSRNSVVDTPLGTIFQSHDGNIQLIDRSLQIQPIGSPVTAYHGNDVTSAVLLDDDDLVVFTLSGQTTMLTWNYRLNKWYEWVVDTAPVMATKYDNKLVWVTAAGQVYKADTSFKDGSTTYALSFQTDWIKVGPNQHGGFLQAVLLGTYVSPHTLTVKVYTNYNSSSANQTETVTVSASVVPYQYRFRFDTKDCTSVMLEVSETPISGSEQSAHWSVLSLEMQDHGRLSLVPSTQDQ